MKIIKMPVAGKNPDTLSDYVTELLTKLDDNVADFPAPPKAALVASLGLLDTTRGELATLEAQVQGKQIEIETAAATVRTDANALGDWAEGVTTDPAKLTKVFELRNAPTPAGATPRVLNLKLSAGDSAGEVDSAWNSLYKDGVKSYEVQTVLNPLNNDPSAGPWQQHPSVTKSKCTLAGFTSGARIWQRVRAIGPQGPGDWSDPATIIVP
ncbi:MAG: hypothetical protein PCFJNLEI_01923 [Verrucomicrobiae bacterium]|nr:hypothetical protein [Verrucomicrobiae bacterium]MCG3148479.1 hypothetical protein [Verrucomicrobiae bacterium]